MKKIKINTRQLFFKISFLIFSGLFLMLPIFCRAMPPGTLLYRTSTDGKMYGYTNDPIIYAEKGIVKNVYSGHVGIYIGQEDGVDYVVEALSDGIVKTPAQYFVNEANKEKFLGAKIPKDLSPLQQAKVVALAKSLVDKKLKYDFDFKAQKGPQSGEWTCVGLTEKIYESADISNPNNLDALEYDPNYYALDITPDGFDNVNVFNERGDCFSTSREFSKIAPYKNLLIPAPELIGYDAGREYQGERYIFLPYTQFLQPSLEDVETDIQISSNFPDSEIRGQTSTLGLVLRWSLINNPLSSLKNIARQTKEFALNLKDKIFGDNSSEITLNESDLKIEPAAKTTTKKINSKTPTVQKKVTVKKADSKINSKQVAEKKPSTVKVAVKKTTSKEEPAPVAPAPKAATQKTNKQNNKTVKAAIYNKTNDQVSQASNPPVNNSYSANTGSSNTSASSNSSSSSSSSSSSNTSVVFPDILINKIYSTGNNDWLELYNPSDQEFDLATAGYRLEKSKTADDPSLIMRIGNLEDGSYPGGTIIPAHGKYLIVKNEANDYYRLQADALATRPDFSWPVSEYTLYLGTDTISSSADSDIVDVVGFGSGATYFLGTAPAPAITDNYILNRVGTSSNNFIDFNLVKADDPGIIWEIASTTEETATSTETATTTEETASTTAATSTSETASSTNEIEPVGSALISKIYSTGANDWLELYNPSDYELDLSVAGYRLEKTKTAEDPDLLMRFGNLEDGYYPGGTIIPAHDYYLIARDDANDYYKNKAQAIATRDEFSWTGSGHTIYLGNEAISSSTDEDIIEAIGFGPEATYYQGTGPAKEIRDNYVLTRIATSSDNYFDFDLFPADDPGIIWATTTTATSSLGLFIPPLPIESSGIRNLWHFDECYGSGKWAVGRWDCSREIGLDYEPLAMTLEPEVDLNNFSVSFYYKKSRYSPNIDFRLANLAGQYLRIDLQSGLLQIEGLPNSGYFYYNIFSDDLWHQFTLVVNREIGYWAVYLDGEEKHKQAFIQTLPRNLTNLTIDGNQGTVLIDEIAIWQRAIAPLEASVNFQAQAPFSPIAEREPQQPVSLTYFWDFQEGDESAGIATTTQDDLQGIKINVLPDYWTWRELNNSALKINYQKNLSADFPKMLGRRDLSLDFWWRNSSYPRGGRARISLRHDNEEMMSLVADYYRQEFSFNRNSGILREGINDAISYDNNWHHLALTYDSYRYLLRFYVDGEEKKSFPFFWIKNEETPNCLEIIGESDSSEIDNLGIWEGTLSPQQIKDIYNNIR